MTIRDQRHGINDKHRYARHAEYALSDFGKLIAGARWLFLRRVPAVEIPVDGNDFVVADRKCRGQYLIY